MLKKLRRFAVLFFWLSALWLALLPLMWHVAGERHWLFLLCQYAPPAVYAMAWLKLVSVAVVSRPRRAYWGLIAPGLWLFFVLIPFGFHRHQGGDFTALSWNIQAGLSGPDKIAGLIQKTNPDLVALQEARTPSAQPGADPVPAIHKKLNYQLARGGERGELAILSRFPIRSQQIHPLAGYSQCLEAVVEREGQLLRVLDVHFMTGDPKGELENKSALNPARATQSALTRRLQAEALVQIVQASSLSTVLLGDFNSPPTSMAYRALREELTDSFAETGWGWGLTYPAISCLWRIDYIWCKNLVPTSTQVLRLPASDHRALLCHLLEGH